MASIRSQHVDIGYCIYCGAVTDLQDEHVVPYSLSGYLVLRNASCASCSRITAKFERTCARSIFGPVRILENFPTRRKAERPEEMEIVVEVDGKKEPVTVAVADLPGFPLIMPLFPQAGIMTGEKKQVPQKMTRHLVINRIDQTKASKLAQRLGVSSLWIKNRAMDNEAFMRLLAKIAHGFVYASRDPKAFTPILPDYILGMDPHLPYVVGMAAVPNFSRVIGHVGYLGPGSRVGHAVGNGLIVREPDGARVVACHIQLFSFLPTPTYEVIVGTVP